MKLSALWAAIMFCCVYAAILNNYKPGILEGMIAGEVDGIQITLEILFGNAVLMAIPIVMVFLSLTFKAKANSRANIILGIFSTGVVLITFAYYYFSDAHTWAYSYVSTITEIVLYAVISRYAWMWPKQEG